VAHLCDAGQKQQDQQEGKKQKQEGRTKLTLLFLTHSEKL
jgi:hypothetical protein